MADIYKTFSFCPHTEQVFWGRFSLTVTYIRHTWRLIFFVPTPVSLSQIFSSIISSLFPCRISNKTRHWKLHRNHVYTNTTPTAPKRPNFFFFLFRCTAILGDGTRSLWEMIGKILTTYMGDRFVAFYSVSIFYLSEHVRSRNWWRIAACHFSGKCLLSICQFVIFPSYTSQNHSRQLFVSLTTKNIMNN